MRFGCDADGFAFYYEGVDPAGLDPPFFLNGPKEVFLVQKVSEADTLLFVEGFPVQAKLVLA